MNAKQSRRPVMRVAAGAVLGVTLGVGGAGVAAAQSQEIAGSVGSIGTLSAGSPVTELPPFYPASGPHPYSDFLTPQDPQFWNPSLATNRLVSPYGLTTPVQCRSFHGVLLECFQQDPDGSYHKLVELTSNLPNVSGSMQPGGGPGTFVYADPAGWGVGN